MAPSPCCYNPHMPSGNGQLHRRTVRSYVLRAGRLTPAQRRALDELMPILGVPDDPVRLDFQALFGRRAEVALEIGFGNGEATWRMALDEPGKDFIAIEVHPPGAGRLLQSLEERSIRNVRVALEDAVPFIEGRIATGSLDGVRIYFPDPWPKKRHHKRRLIQPRFVELLAEKMKPGAFLHLATDWEPYAAHMLEVLDAAAEFENLSPTGDYCRQPDWRPDTKYERRGDRLGHETRDLVFRRKP